MRTIAHISDLHFGRADAAAADGLLRTLAAVAPDVCVVSGDLTQRARTHEFEAARDYLAKLPGHVLVVPGNHDVPLWNLFRRFWHPLTKYARYISSEVMPEWVDEEVSIVGINTARSLTHKNGRINRQQVRAAAERLQAFPPDAIKLVVTHHPFDLAPEFGRRELVGRARMALQHLAAAGADVLLAGHLHEAYTGGTAHRYPMARYSALVVQAGTAISTRRRGSPNSFNLLRISPPEVEVEILDWHAAEQQFRTLERKQYRRETGEGFVRLDAAAVTP